MPQLSPDRWQRGKDLFLDAIDLAPEERESFLRSACGGDTELFQYVENLLAHHEENETFLESSQIRSFATNGATQATGQRIGAYKIVRELGQGGMGAVYLATRADDQYQKQVAIKLIRGASSEFLRRRFRSERQILATLDHPNIARMLDGGTTEDGSPYFVMEFIEGQPIDEYCDVNQLTTTERLKLFQQVCSAVQYAHQNLIIHRDLKPGNILVTKDGVPKLLDFGIAKLLANNESLEANETATGMRLMTPAYASPEQVCGETVTTASDVYSLGIILYELLTGHTPYNTQGKSLPELIKVVGEEEPALPSRRVKSEIGSRKSEIAGRKMEFGEQHTELSSKKMKGKRWFASLPTSDFRLPTSSLRGDLDNIVLMALRKEPNRRYPSVEQFAADIRRHLDGLPVIAHKDTFSYRATKFLKRNRVSVAAATVVLLAIVAGVTATIIQRNRAERRFNEVRKLANAVLFKYHDKIADLPGSTEVSAEMIKDSLEYLDSLAREAGNDLSLLRELAGAYEKIGSIQGNRFVNNVNDTAGMLRSYQRCVEIRTAVVARNSSDPQIHRELAISYENLGDGLSQTGDLGGALAQYQMAFNIVAGLTVSDPSQPRHRLYLARLHNQLAIVLGFPGQSNMGDTASALEHNRQAVELCEGLLAAEPTNTRYRWGLITYRRGYGVMLIRQVITRVLSNNCAAQNRSPRLGHRKSQTM